jgi:hypothetical protein
MSDSGTHGRERESDKAIIPFSRLLYTYCKPLYSTIVLESVSIRDTQPHASI